MLDFSSLAESLGRPGWQYRDLPRLSPDLMAQFKALIGEENLFWVTYADYGDSQRGQVLISPDGLARITAHAASAIEARQGGNGEAGAVADESAVRASADAPIDGPTLSGHEGKRDG